MKSKFEIIKDSVCKNLSQDNNKVKFALDDKHNGMRVYYYVKPNPFESMGIALEIMKYYQQDNLILGILPNIEQTTLIRLITDLLPNNPLVAEHQGKKIVIENINTFNQYFCERLYDVFTVLAGYVYHIIAPFFSLILTPGNE